MAILDILQYPDPRLRQKAAVVTTFDKRLRQIVEDMIETMYAKQGVGLAGTQVNIHQRIFTLDASEERNQPQVVINPDIVHLEGEVLMEEGCLSVHTAFDKVPQATKVHLRGVDLHNKPFEWHAEGFLAHIIQHEVDHLSGKLFVDYLSRLKQERLLKKIRKQDR